MANSYTPTYSELVLELQDLTENTNSEFISNIPRFVHRAQDQVQRDLALDIWNLHATISVNAASIARNADYLVIRSLFIPASRRWIEKRHIDYVRGYGGTGTPKVWAEDTDLFFIFAPTPDATYSVSVEYYQRLAGLSASNETNWITRNAGDLLLLQSLINAHAYLINPERMQECAQLYAALLGTATRELRESERNRYEPVRATPKPSLQAGAIG